MKRRIFSLALLTLALALLPGAAPADGDFKPWFSESGVSVEIARQASGPAWVRGAAELPVAAEKIAALLADYANYAALFGPGLKSAVVIKQKEPTARLHLVWHYPWPLKNRDGLVRYEMMKTDGGGYQLEWRSDARPGDPQEGVRISRIEGRTRIIPLGPARSRVSYSYYGDLGGDFSAAAQEKAWRKEPVEYFAALRRALKVKAE